VERASLYKDVQSSEKEAYILASNRNINQSKGGNIVNKSGIGVGSASIVLVFAVLCLTIFSLITYVVAGNEKALVDAKAELVTGYYEADAAAELILSEIIAEDITPETVRGIKINSGWDKNLGMETTYFHLPISDIKALYVNFTIRDGSFDILSWRMYDTDEWEIDDSINIWDGN